MTGETQGLSGSPLTSRAGEPDALSTVLGSSSLLPCLVVSPLSVCRLCVLSQSPGSDSHSVLSSTPGRTVPVSSGQDNFSCRNSLCSLHSLDYIDREGNFERKNVFLCKQKEKASTPIFHISQGHCESLLRRSSSWSNPAVEKQATRTPNVDHMVWLLVAHFLL